jgi:hypothetical protein
MKLYGVVKTDCSRILSVVNLSKFVSATIFESSDGRAALNLFFDDQTDYQIYFQTINEAEKERFKIVTEYLGFPKDYAIKVCGGDFSVETVTSD